jgi:CRISPR-associated protein Cas1
MKRLLNTLYVTTPDAYLLKDGENIVVKQNEEIIFRVPIHNIENIVCFGYIGASPSAMHLCCENGVGLVFLTPNGKFLARVTGKVSGNVLLRRKQFKMVDQDTQRLRMSMRFVESKIHNSRRVLQRTLRDHDIKTDPEAISHAIDKLKGMIERVSAASNVEEIRGIEGEAANTYFGIFDSLIINQKEHFRFEGRFRRPPTDYVNALLSFVYTLLAHECTSALESVGLDPQVGFLHTDRPGRNSLALDLMEELRPYLADRLVLSLINRKQVSEKGFIRRENDSVLMTDETRKEVILNWQNKKGEEIIHPFLDEKINIGLIPYVQAMLLSRNVRGDLNDYPPFLWK